MKIDKEKVKRMAALSDEALWGEITAIARLHGLNLPEKVPPHSELEKIRGSMLSEKINISGALKVINNYRKGKS